MKILLISTNRNDLSMPVMPVGACIIAHAAEHAGHTVQLLELMFTRDAIRDIESAPGSVCVRRSGDIRGSSDGGSGLREWKCRERFEVLGFRF
jgi:hypothetical protein